MPETKDFMCARVDKRSARQAVNEPMVDKTPTDGQQIKQNGLSSTKVDERPPPAKSDDEMEMNY